MKLLIQPADGIAPLLAGIKNARKSIEIVIFRLDLREVEAALKAAVERGVAVQALVAWTSRDGERSLRKLEQRLLDCGVTVTRTADNLVRYHDKFMIIDQRVLYLLAFNYTALDVRHSRSFGIITRDRQLVQEALRLFAADTAHQPFTPALNNFLVSPLNARQQLAAFLQGARRQLLIYDNQITDNQMIKILQARATAGVEIRIIGHIGKRSGGLTAQKLRDLRLHTRIIIRDGHQAFIGSQSLRRNELDARREVGLIVRDAKVIKGLLAVFEADWQQIITAEKQAVSASDSIETAARIARQALEAVASELPLLFSEVSEAVILTATENHLSLPEPAQVQAAVRDTVIEAVREKIREAVTEAVKEAVHRVRNAA